MEKWLHWFSALQAIAQNGLTYTKDPFDVERYQAIQKIVASMFAEITHEPIGKINQLFTDEYGYATPKVDVRAAIFKNQKILLVKERSDQLWTLPGGWADINESPAEAVVKEVREESGYEVKVVKLLAVFDKQKHEHPPHWPHTYKLFFLCKIISGEPKANLEVSEIKFFDRDNLPSLSTPRVTEAQIFRMYDHLVDMGLPTDFDAE